MLAGVHTGSERSGASENCPWEGPGMLINSPAESFGLVSRILFLALMWLAEGAAKRRIDRPKAQEPLWLVRF